MADPIDMNPFLTESQRRQIRSNVDQGPSDASFTFDSDGYMISASRPDTPQMRTLPSGVQVNPTRDLQELQQRARQRPIDDLVYRGEKSQPANMPLLPGQPSTMQRMPLRPDGDYSQDTFQQPDTIAQLPQPPNMQRFNIQGIPADSQYAQEARRQAGISEADFQRRMQQSLEGLSPEQRRQFEQLQGAGLMADFPFPGETQQIQRRPMPGGRSMDEIRRQLDRVQRMEVQRAPQRQTPLVVARDEQIQGSDRGEMGRFYGPQGRTEDIDPLLIQATPQPRTSAQLAESARAKAGSGQPLDAEERQWFSSTIRKQMQDAGYTEEQIQRQMERIDPETGMLPRRMR